MATARARLLRFGLGALVLVLGAALLVRGGDGNPAAGRPQTGDTTMTTKDESGRPLPATDAAWKERLSPEAYGVLRCSLTEAPFTGKYWDNHEPGAYRCAACGQLLFSSDTKFDSGTGWPSFSDATHGAIEEREDDSLGMKRVEILCSRCHSHLGHVFSDGPAPTGLRYCVNSAALEFVPRVKETPSARPASPPVADALFGAGCFWGVEEAFRRTPGVVDTEVGYAGGTTDNPTYPDVCTGRTGHTEVVRVRFDPAKTTYAKLLERFFEIHDPTQVDRQGPDVGRQYRSVVFYEDEAQRDEAEKAVTELAGSGRWRRPIATAIEKAPTFWRAEEYHQRYAEKHGGAGCHLP